MKSVGEPDARNGHVRFDERGWETERVTRHRARPRLYHETAGWFPFALPIPFALVEPAASAASRATATSAPPSSEARALGTSLVHGQRPTVESLARQLADGSLKIFSFGQLNKSKSFGVPGRPVTNHYCRSHTESCVVNELGQGIVSSGSGKITDKEL
jgi:hypothetical protein